ncbi:MAG TPA: DPP IV N-terminal domain-containing protein [Sandaracinaceae bacterium LLY-WYZ-13_1]|nr:DPP IV N-terminal domain-containing protein [Sandaracinaceae bacterium LLY-WYZ-13_1]
MTASLLTALAAGPLTGCGASSEEPADPNESGGGGAPAEEGPRPAPAARPDASFLDAYAETNRFRLGHPRAIEVLPDGSGVLFLRSGPRSFEGRLFFFDAERGEERPILSAEDLIGEADEELTAQERARRERMRMTARGIASFRVSPDGSQILVPLSGRLFLVDRARIGEEGAVRELESEAGPAVDPRFSPDGSHVATVREGDLYVIDVATGAEQRLTERPSEHVTNGLAEFVAQEEMGRMRGFWWSPDGASIAYQQTDTAALERMHILDPMHPEREAQAWPYPRPGKTNASVRLGVIPIAGGPTRWIDWDHDAHEYLATVRWPSAGPLTLLVQDRAQEHERLLAADPATGSTRELLTESDEAWINLDQTTPRWLSDGERFLWSSEREGQWRLELRDAEGNAVRELTGEGFGYRGLLAVDEERGVAWVRASEEPTETHVWTVPLGEEGEPTQRSEAPGEHDAEVARDGSLWVHTKQTLDGEIASVVRRADGEVVGTLESEAEAPPFEPSLSFETIGRRDWRAVVIRPRDFDENLRYPVILHVYGGPHARYVTKTPSRYLLSQWQADHNYIVVSIDGRGTPARGREWERAIDGDFIAAPLEDQVEALQQLGDEHPEMDMDRVGVWGWSFGGYFTAMAVLRRPDIFRAGVAGAPVSEWRDYDTHYTERYIGLPEEAGEEGAYRRSSVLTYADEAASPEEHRPLLVIHGTADDNVYFSHALKLQNALFRAGRPVDLLALSGLTHMVPEAEVMRRMHQRVMGFFERSLRAEGADGPPAE